jgi:arsenite methyltransferase
MNSEQIYERVQEHYGSAARSDGDGTSSAIAKAFGYSEDELSRIPGDSNLGLSCGNPHAFASLSEVSVVS